MSTCTARVRDSRRRHAGRVVVHVCASLQANPDGGAGIYAGMAEEQQGWGFVGQGLESRVSQMPVADADGAGVDTADAADTDRAIEAWQEKKRQASIAAPDTAAGGEAHFGTETAADGATQNQAAGDSDDAWIDDAMSGATWQGFAIRYTAWPTPSMVPCRPPHHPLPMPGPQRSVGVLGACTYAPQTGFAVGHREAPAPAHGCATAIAQTRGFACALTVAHGTDLH